MVGIASLSKQAHKQPATEQIITSFQSIANSSLELIRCRLTLMQGQLVWLTIRSCRMSCIDTEDALLVQE